MKIRSLLLGLSFLAIGVCLGFFGFAEGAEPTVLNKSETVSTDFENAVIKVAEKAGKAVVSISTEHTEKIKSTKRVYRSSPFRGSPFEENDSFRSFFDDFFGEMPDREFKQSGLGSGVIIDAEGYILTNEHVINGADKITVNLPDGRQFKGEVKGRDERSDLAVIKINAHNLPFISLGNSDDIKIGQWVVAIGNPFGFAMQNPEPTVTAGVIGALHRSLGNMLSRDRDYNDLIQTDAAINPGNSGGPLVNLKGEVVGINVAIFSTSGGYQGVGFAIPANRAKRIMTKLKEGKKILYGWLGITVQDLTEDLAGYFGASSKNGVLVAKVLEDGPAMKAGLKDKDIIKSFGGKTINNVKELLDSVGKAEVGSRVKVAVLRDKKEMVFEVVISERPSNLTSDSFEGMEEKSEPSWRGLQVQDLSPEMSRRFGIEERAGVLITDVEPGSPADDSGLNQGEIILEINKQPVKNLADYKRIIKDSKGNCLIRTSRGFYVIKSENK
ncbi:MAG: Do family serine endopeptidase [Candidatus Omnitrophica bacterium]|nr:Do family serine endopeptidase [Candidatus Omnitrophota bacterium]